MTKRKNQFIKTHITEEKTYNIISAIEENNLSFSEIGKQYNVSHTTVSRLKARYHKNPEKYQGLIDHFSGLKDFHTPDDNYNGEFRHNSGSHKLYVNRHFIKWFKSLGISYPVAGKRFGVNHTTIMRLVNGQYTPTVVNAYNYSLKLGVDLGKLWNVKQLSGYKKLKTDPKWCSILSKAEKDYTRSMLSIYGKRLMKLNNYMEEIGIKFDALRFILDE
jgi:transcriptional regulator with XRE-family HTH domain